MYLLVNSRAIEILVNWSFVEKYDMNAQKLSKSVPVYNIDSIPNEAG